MTKSKTTEALEDTGRFFDDRLRYSTLSLSRSGCFRKELLDIVRCFGQDGF